jgi:hypothetical protein
MFYYIMKKSFTIRTTKYFCCIEIKTNLTIQHLKNNLHQNLIRLNFCKINYKNENYFHNFLLKEENVERRKSRN